MEVTQLPLEAVEAEEESLVDPADEQIGEAARASFREKFNFDGSPRRPQIDLDEEQDSSDGRAPAFEAEARGFDAHSPIQIPAATLDLVAALRLGFSQQLGALSQVLLNARGLLASSWGLPPAAQDALAEPLNSFQAALSDAYTDLGKVMWVLRP